MSRYLPLFMLALPLSGCVMHMHANTNVIAPNAAVPVSLSETVRDVNGDIVAPDKQQLLGLYDETFHAYNMPWGAAAFTPTHDVSQSINKAVEAVHGDAVTELTVSVDQCWTFVFIYVWYLPFVPSCANYRVRGHIIRVPAIAPAPPKADATANLSVAAALIAATPRSSRKEHP
jgi:hypothetical protein